MIIHVLNTQFLLRGAVWISIEVKVDYIRLCEKGESNDVQTHETLDLIVEIRTKGYTRIKDIRFVFA